MIVSRSSDQVFQLSLTEIAFTIAFILLLLLGYLVMRETDAKKEAQARLAEVQELTVAQQAFEAAAEQLKSGLSKTGSTNPDEIISNLLAEAKVATERDRLLVKVKDLEAQISALSEIRQIVSGAAKDAGHKEVAERVVSAIALQTEAEQALDAARKVFEAVHNPHSIDAPAPTLEPSSFGEKSEQSKQGTSQLPLPRRENTREEVRRSIEVAAAVERALRDVGGSPLPQGKEAEAVSGLVRTAVSLRGLERTGKGVEAVLKENADLRGQMANLRSRSNAVGKGLDHPPCWADEAGNIEYLFTVELRQGSVAVTRAWPDRRNPDVAKLPMVDELLITPVSYERFRAASRPILAISKQQDPECRHFVVMQNTIETRREADKARWVVEEFFYKREARR